MKKLLYLILLILFASCTKVVENSQTTNNGKTILRNFNGTGVDFVIDDMGLTRSGVADVYRIEAKVPNEDITLEGIVTIDLDTFGNRTVSLYETSDALADDLFVGAYIVDENMQIIGVITDEGYEYDTSARRPGESNWDCIRREYNAMKAAYESRPLDDIACGALAWGIGCKVLVLIVAGVECDKTTYSL